MRNNILIVEDNPVNIEIYIDLLSHNYNISTAVNCKQAMEALDKSIPDLILLDLLLPDCNGSELCFSVKNREATRHIPVIVITSLNQPAEKIKVLETGANDFLTKPIDKRELILKIENHLTIFKQYHRIQQQKREISQFIEMIVHDLKGPLTVIKGYSELIGDFSKDQFAQDHIPKVINSADKMLSAINRILDIRKIESVGFNINIEQIDITTILDEIVVQWQEMATKKRILIQNSTQDKGLMVEGDREKVRTVIENLVDNALKFSPEETEIELQIMDFSGDYIRIQVTDQGLGLNEEDKQSAFREVRKLSARPTGDEVSTGLGLVIVRRFVELMGGEVGVESPGKNKGATFWFTLKKNRTDSSFPHTPQKGFLNRQ